MVSTIQPEPAINEAIADQKAQVLLQSLAGLKNVIVAYSGGVDSSLLAYYARAALGDQALIVIARSASLANDELEFARKQGAAFGWNVLEIDTDETEKPEYLRNDEQRCYFCKSTLFEAMQRIAVEEKYSNLAYGANINDLSDYRPGHQAARERQVLSPLQEAGLVKGEIRYLAKKAELPSWDRPQAACLSSRFPTFQPITIQRLSQVDKAESSLHKLGLKQLRVRHHDSLARIELSQEDLELVLSGKVLVSDIVSALKEYGFKYITLDLEGYRQGSSNAQESEKPGKNQSE
jgi:pyridinium-3,5-biscarboxylic acid mononucleotide sulfurtransferase